MSLKVKATVRGGTRRQRELFHQAVSIVEETINSAEFKRKVANPKHPFTYLKNTDLKYPIDIYEHFMSGSDKFDTDRDGVMLVDVTLYLKKYARVIGYTYPSTYKTWFNTKYMTLDFLVGNLVHEYMHNLNYTHPFRRTATRKYSVPYQYGYIAGQIARSNRGTTSVASSKRYRKPWYKRMISWLV